jgi:hypothetical protein
MPGSIGNWPAFGGLPGPEYRTRVENDTFIMEFVGPRQLLLMSDFNAMVHNQCLSMAHAQGLHPVGEIFISTSEVRGEAESDQLVEGESLDEKMRRRRNQEMRQIFGGQDMAKMTVRAEVLLANADIRLDTDEDDTLLELSDTDLDEELRKLLGDA